MDVFPKKKKIKITNSFDFLFGEKNVKKKKKNKLKKTLNIN